MSACIQPGLQGGNLWRWLNSPKAELSEIFNIKLGTS
jgi:hypothetical protein